MRTMSNSFEGKVFYESVYHRDTGAIARVTEVSEKNTRLGNYFYEWLVEGSSLNDREPWTMHPDAWRTRQERRGLLADKWREKFGWRDRAFSPVPETLDVQVTNWCNFGCDLCYQDSKTSDDHAEVQLIEDILCSFDQMPYQVAFGGGEPTAHPDFPEILRITHELGAVPNFTTAGHLVRDEVLAAANEFCGGVALTYHVFKGPEWFRKTYMAWREALNIQMNVHVIADVTVLKSLGDLLEMAPETGPMNIVLLAYHPIGRGSMVNILPKRIYQDKLPEILAELRENDFQIAFSEGLLPYFFSRPELGIDMRFAERSEGIYSAYVDRYGRMSHSSFEPPSDGWRSQTLYDQSLQEQWNKGIGWVRDGDRDLCERCPHVRWCAQTHDTLAMLCNKYPHNRPRGRGDERYVDSRYS